MLRSAQEQPSKSDFNRLLGLVSLGRTLMLSGRPSEALELWVDLAESPDLRDGLRYLVLQEMAHTHIALQEPDVALDIIHKMAEEDLKERQPTSAAFCAVADYFREIGDNRAAVWFIAKVLGDQTPVHPVHRNVVDTAREALGDEFDVEWRHGEKLDIYSLMASFEKPEIQEASSRLLK